MEVGPIFPSSKGDIAGGDVAWSDTSNIVQDNDLGALTTNVPNGQSTNKIECTYSELESLFTGIATTRPVLGIKVHVKARADQSVATLTQKIIVTINGVALPVNTTVIGTSLSYLITTTGIPTTTTLAAVLSGLAANLQYVNTAGEELDFDVDYIAVTVVLDDLGPTGSAKANRYLRPMAG